MYGSEVWVLRSGIKSRITAAEMKFMRTTAGYTRMDRKRNEDVLRELEAEANSGANQEISEELAEIC